MILHDVSVSFRTKKKSLIHQIDIFSEKIISVESFSSVLNSFSCYFAHKNEIMYKKGSKNNIIYFLIEGKANCLIKADLQETPRPRADKQQLSVVTSKVESLPVSIFGDCTTLLGKPKEETLIAETNCIFLMIDEVNFKKSITSFEFDKLTKYLNEKLEKNRKIYTQFLENQHSHYKRMSTILSKALRSTINTSGPIKNDIRKDRVENMFKFMSKSMVNKMGIDIKNKTIYKKEPSNTLRLKKNIQRRIKPSLYFNTETDDLIQDKVCNERSLSPIEMKFLNLKNEAFSNHDSNDSKAFFQD